MTRKSTNIYHFGGQPEDFIVSFGEWTNQINLGMDKLQHVDAVDKFSSNVGTSSKDT